MSVNNINPLKNIFSINAGAVYAGSGNTLYEENKFAGVNENNYNINSIGVNSAKILEIKPVQSKSGPWQTKKLEEDNGIILARNAGYEKCDTRPDKKTIGLTGASTPSEGLGKNLWCYA